MTHTADITAAAARESATGRCAPRMVCYTNDRAAWAAIDKYKLSVTLCPSHRLSELHADIRANAPAIVVAEFQSEPRGEASAIIASVRRAHPSIYFIGIVSYATTQGDAMVGMVRAGLDAVSLRESGTLAADIEAAIRFISRPSILLTAAEDIGLCEVLHPEAATVVRIAISASSWPNVGIVARALECSPRELQRRFATAQLGVPFDLLQTTRWILANAALRSTMKDQHQVAVALGFSTVGAMRDALRRSLSVTLDEITREEVARDLWARLVDQFGGDRLSFAAHAQRERNRLALTATLYNFEVNLSNVDRNVYETITFKVAQQPSETNEYLIARVLAYILEYREGIGFSGGIAEAEQPAIFVRDLTGTLKAWIDIGSPDANRLHKASKAAPRVAVYTHKEPRLLIKALAGERIHRVEELELYAFDRELIAALVGRLDRRMKLDLSVTDGHLYITIGGKTIDGAVERVSLG